MGRPPGAHSHTHTQTHNFPVCKMPPPLTGITGSLHMCVGEGGGLGASAHAWSKLRAQSHSRNLSPSPLLTASYVSGLESGAACVRSLGGERAVTCST